MDILLLFLIIVIIVVIGASLIDVLIAVIIVIIVLMITPIIINIRNNSEPYKKNKQRSQDTGDCFKDFCLNTTDADKCFNCCERNCSIKNDNSIWSCNSQCSKKFGKDPQRCAINCNQNKDTKVCMSCCKSQCESKQDQDFCSAACSSPFSPRNHKIR